MTTTVGQMTPSELSDLIESILERKLLELFSDPDSGLVLRPDLVERLRRQQSDVTEGERGLSLDEVRRRLQLG